MQIIQNIPLSNAYMQKYSSEFYSALAVSASLILFALIYLGIKFLLFCFDKSDQCDEETKRRNEDKICNAVVISGIVFIVGFILGFQMLLLGSPQNKVISEGRNATKTKLIGKDDINFDCNITCNHKYVGLVLKDGKYKIYTVTGNWNGPDAQDKLVSVYTDTRTRQNIYKANTPAGRAFLKIVQYLGNQHIKPVNYTWQAWPYKVQFSYDDEKGHHKLVCYVDNKKTKPDKEEIVVNY